MRRSWGCLWGLAAAVLLAGWPGAEALAAEPGPAGGEAPFGRLWWPGAEGSLLRRGLVNLTKLAVALAATALLAWGAWLRRTGRPEARRGLRDRWLGVLGFVAFLGWWNFFQFHYPGFVHTNNTFVYYAGAKYFPELGYGRLYECVAVADLRAGLRGRVLRRKITNLETYDLESTAQIVAHPERCTRHFEPARWSAFERDVGWFRSRIPAHTWEDMQRDHGYNPPPAWGLLGTLLASTGPASALQIFALTVLDSLLDLAAWGFALWTFGWRAACVAILYWGTNHIAEFSWTGGSFLRDDWLAATVIGVCLLRRGHPASAGFLLGVASLLRIFPVLALAGVGATALLGMLRERRLAVPAETRRVAGGALLAGLLVVPLASAVAGGVDAWGAFAENTRLHVGTPGSNLVGLRTLLSYDPDARLVDLVQHAKDPSAAWKAARLEAAAARRGLQALLVAAYLLLLGRALVDQPSWVAAILGLGALPVLLEPTCYYTSVLAIFGFLWLRRESVGVALCALAVASWGVAACFTEWDDIFLWSSVPLLAFVVYATAVVREPLRPARG
ncbi:MAG: hypothetical protein QNK04_31610 [Myxococcota bacterium]|nr:hypothetical protein [Myxococcota bacterium]